MRRPVSAVDLAFVAGVTLIGSRAAARLLGLPQSVGTVVAVGSMAVVTAKAGPPPLQRCAAAVLHPANRLLLLLQDVKLPPAIAGQPSEEP